MMLGNRYLFLVITLFALNSYAQQAVPVKFALKAPSGTQTVHIAGDFNEWSSTKHPLSFETDTEQWTIELSLPPGVYEYRFLINGLNWIKDPANPLWGGEK